MIGEFDDLLMQAFGRLSKWSVRWQPSRCSGGLELTLHDGVQVFTGREVRLTALWSRDPDIVRNEVLCRHCDHVFDRITSTRLLYQGQWRTVCAECAAELETMCTAAVESTKADPRSKTLCDRCRAPCRLCECLQCEAWAKLLCIYCCRTQRSAEETFSLDPLDARITTARSEHEVELKPEPHPWDSEDGDEL